VTETRNPIADRKPATKAKSSIASIKSLVESVLFRRFMMLQWPLVEIGKLLLLWFVYAMKETMKAVALTRYLPINDPESLQDFELPKPVPGKRDLLVRIEAVSVNPVDVKVRASKPGIEVEPKILGWDAAGIVERVGAMSHFSGREMRSITPDRSRGRERTASITWLMNESWARNPRA
jgi:Alcohol dehydrogenase GroES-like domain